MSNPYSLTTNIFAVTSATPAIISTKLSAAQKERLGKGRIIQVLVFADTTDIKVSDTDLSVHTDDYVVATAYTPVNIPAENALDTIYISGGKARIVVSVH